MHNANVRFKLHRNVADDEWIVKVFINNKYNEDHSYFTNDKADAEATMADMKKRYNENPKAFLGDAYPDDEKPNKNNKSGKDKQNAKDLIMAELAKINKRLDSLETIDTDDDDDSETAVEIDKDKDNESEDDDDLFF